VGASAPLARPVFSELKLSLPPGTHQLLTPHPDPDRRAMPLMEPQGGDVVFDRTDFPGVYRLVAGNGSGTNVPVAALNVPAEESELERIEPTTIAGLLPDVAVSFVRADDGTASGTSATLAQSGGQQGATSSFPLAALALAFFVGEVLLGWSIGRGGTRGLTQSRQDAKQEGGT
ncbi:hypothetical protein HQ576_02300, partial [bacterium]|nr:hypothetical protein [bacterium]